MTKLDLWMASIIIIALMLKKFNKTIDNKKHYHYNGGITNNERKIIRKIIINQQPSNYSINIKLKKKVNNE